MVVIVQSPASTAARVASRPGAALLSRDHAVATQRTALVTAHALVVPGSKSMTVILLYRFIKTVAILLLAAATAGAFVPEQARTRQRMVYGMGTVGLALTWIAGFGLLRSTGASMAAPWIAGSVVLSVVWFHAVVWAVEQPQRRQARWALAASLPLLAAVGLMVFRPA